MIPPAVDPDDPPIYIKKQLNKILACDKPEKETLLNPAVRGVTVRKKVFINRSPNVKSFKCDKFCSVSKKNKKPPINKIKVTLKVSLE